ncbi:MAG: hypothetical protein ACLFMX_05400 [Halobacteriales archaeon]
MRNPLISVIDRFSDRTVTVYECRRCGTNLADEHATCPVCETTDVAVYDIEPAN